MTSWRVTLPFGFDRENIPLWDKMVQKATLAGIFPDDFDSCMDYHDAVVAYCRTLPKEEFDYKSDDEELEEHEEHEMPLASAPPCPSFPKPYIKPKSFLEAFIAFIWSLIGFFVGPTGATEFRYVLSAEIRELLSAELTNASNSACGGLKFMRALDAIENAHNKHVVDVLIATACCTVCVAGTLVVFFLYV
jgi:hypothetical protein